MEHGDLNEMDAVLEDTEGYDNCLDSSNIQEPRFRFVCSKEVNTIKNSGIGILKPILTDPTISMIQVKSVDLTLEALKDSTLVVLTKTSAGKQNTDPDDVVDIKISPADGVKMGTKNMWTDGRIELPFIPKVAGQLKAEVQVNGNHVSNSPLVMNVKPQKMRIIREFQMKGLETKSSDFTGIAVNRGNNKIAVADKSSHCVHVFNLNGDLLLTYGSQGNGQGQLNEPRALAFLNDADLVIADFGNDRICIVNIDTGTWITNFGQWGSGIGQFKYPRGVHVDEDGNIIVSDNHNHRLQVFSWDGETPACLRKEGSFDPVSTVIHEGRFYVVDDNKCFIHVFKKKDDKLDNISTIGKRGSADGELKKPRGLAVANEHLLVCDYGNSRIQKFTLDGRLVGKMDISNPCCIAVLKGGKSLVTAGQRVVLLSK